MLQTYICLTLPCCIDVIDDHTCSRRVSSYPTHTGGQLGQLLTDVTHDRTTPLLDKAMIG